VQQAEMSPLRINSQAVPWTKLKNRSSSRRYGLVDDEYSSDDNDSDGEVSFASSDSSEESSLLCLLFDTGHELSDDDDDDCVVEREDDDRSVQRQETTRINSAASSCGRHEWEEHYILHHELNLFPAFKTSTTALAPWKLRGLMEHS